MTAECTTVRLFELLKTAMAESAVTSLFGSNIVASTPDFLKCHWDFDKVAGPLLNFMQRSSVRDRDCFRRMTRKHIG